MKLNFFWLLPLLLTLGACMPTNDPANPRNVTFGNSEEAEVVVSTIDYGNGVFYVEASGSEFGNFLSQLSAKHPAQTITWGVAKVDRDEKPAGYFVRITAPRECVSETAEDAPK